MSETVNQETTTATANQTAQEPTEKLFTQEQVNQFFNKRYSELMSELETFKTKAAKYDELEEAKKDELQKATERAEKLQAELDAIKKTQSLKEMREKVAKDAGIPINSMSLITGETEEACKEQADIIKAMMVPGHYPSVPDGGEVTNLNNGSARDVFKDWAQQMND